MVIFQFNNLWKPDIILAVFIALIPYVEVANKFIIQDKEDW